MTYSPLNEDYSWRDVNRWAITWVGDQWVDVNDEDALVHEYKLSQNYPNPFNPSTTINYSLKENGFVTLKIYNILGQEMVTLVNKELNAGQHTVNFDASKLSSGVYIYQIQAGNFTSSKKMLLLK
ncbi:MAG: T9SS type A sorting domain-containing protein [Melioribacteraceae bacterium]|nr:T9SS type A sorting domain-containing protein [Melioribacteraceae bacterium]MCF8354893.1 T9SS type A sorting domain-containing protein [Melioribacteraceae bacterium]MCF8393885.1 T9SS type A sorting domain-containing protein [Melioribacteraceae bacterium]MCF8419657.1 T9SS type A sorting domain-containing protein [Melioribacteraceae bacterium]